jgi:uncharacterized protein (TIGR01777 family)
MDMKVLITGGTGLVGSELKRELMRVGCAVNVLTRQDIPDQPRWDIEKNHIDLKDLGPFDAVINLAGENIATGRWNAEKKRRIRESRVHGTRLLSEFLAMSDAKPKVLISASAIGYYGDRGLEACDECAGPGDDFLADVCQEWEAATAPAVNAGIRVVNTRIGVVLSSKGGALEKMLLPFKLCLGGPVGDGKQIMSWISITDLVRAIIFILERPDLEGPVNLVAPNPISNGGFAKCLGERLKRPAVMPLPTFMVRLLFGEMGDALLLSSTNVIPGQLRQAEFKFNHPDLESAFKDLL